jgi:hypothetical protein
VKRAKIRSDDHQCIHGIDYSVTCKTCISMLCVWGSVWISGIVGVLYILMRRTGVL